MRAHNIRPVIRVVLVNLYIMARRDECSSGSGMDLHLENCPFRLALQHEQLALAKLKPLACRGMRFVRRRTEVPRRDQDSARRVSRSTNIVV